MHRGITLPGYVYGYKLITRVSHEGKPLKWEMKHGMIECPCPFCSDCPGVAQLKSELRVFDGREIIYAFYICDKCSQSFTTTEIDGINFDELIANKNIRRKVVEHVKSILKITQ